MSWIHLFSLLLALAHLGVVSGLTNVQLRERSIYQVITDRFARPDGRTDTRCDPVHRAYCGGGWKGIEQKLDYIQGMGFDTVWISPVVANIPGIPGSSSYHGYWASDMTRLNSHFGSEEDLIDLSNALHARGMFLMVDVVANHLGAIPGHFRPDMYGPLYTKDEHFHPFCIPDDWDDQEQAEQCWLTDHMADLNTENPAVVFTLQAWVQRLVQTIGIDAIRVDTVKHVRKDFWPGFVNAAGVAAMGEVLHGDPAYLRQYQLKAMDSILDYATFFHLRRTFTSNTEPIDELTSMITRVHRTIPDPSLLGSFLDNHDFPRLASQVDDPALLKNAAVWPFVSDGFPIVYQGLEHGLTGGADPMNREAIWLHGYTTTKPLYHMFKRLNHARRRALAFPSYLTTHLKWHKYDSHTVVLAKPPMVTILTNFGSASPPRVYYLSTATTSYAPHMPVIDVLTGQVFATDPTGGLAVTVLSGEPRVFLPFGVWEGRKQPVWQNLHIESRPPIAAPGPSRKKSSASLTHSRTSSRSSVFSWLNWGK